MSCVAIILETVVGRPKQDVQDVSFWQAASLVQTVFSRKRNNPGNDAGYKVNCRVFMKYPGWCLPAKRIGYIHFFAVLSNQKTHYQASPAVVSRLKRIYYFQT